MWYAQADGRYETFPHSADLGFIAYGDNFPQALANLIYGFYDQSVELTAVNKTERRKYEVTPTLLADPDTIVHDVLREVIYRFATEHFIGKEVEISQDKKGKITIHLQGETFDASRHQGINEIKAITYHNLLIDNKPTSCTIKAIFDM